MELRKFLEEKKTKLGGFGIEPHKRSATDAIMPTDQAQINLIEEIEKNCGPEIELKDVFVVLTKGIENLLNVSANHQSSTLTPLLQEAVGILSPIPQKLASIEIELSQKNLMSKAVENIKNLSGISKQSLLNFVDIYIEDMPDKTAIELAKDITDWVKAMDASSSDGGSSDKVDYSDMDEDYNDDDDEDYDGMKDYD